MSIGALVRHENEHYNTLGIVVDDMKESPNASGKYRMVTVQWLDGMGTGIYWTDELEVVCE